MSSWIEYLSSEIPYFYRSVFAAAAADIISAEAPLSALKSAIATAMRPPCPGVPILGPDHGQWFQN